jgi:tRNA(Ile)-lysidine synthase
MSAVVDDDAGIRWIRPLLSVSRARARALADLLESNFVDDPTNEDRQHLRVRVREEVLPVLRDHNPQLEQAMLSAAEQAGDAVHALDAWTAKECEGRRRGPNDWSLQGFHELPRAIRTRLLRQVCVLGGADPSELRFGVVFEIDAAATAIARTLAGLEGRPGGERPRRWDLRPRCTVRVSKRGIEVTGNLDTTASE